MKSIGVVTLFLLLAAVEAFTQNTVRIAPDEAAKHLVTNPSPNYPPLAEQAQIQGNIILEISIDESGAVSVQRLISGHPMLSPAAIDGIKRWKYQPFLVNGTPVRAVTFVSVRFGNPWNHDAKTRATIQFLHSFWSAEEAAVRAFDAQDFETAEREMKKARELLASLGEPASSGLRWRLSMDSGDLRFAQRNYEDAEREYKEALAAGQEHDKNTAQAAAAHDALGRLYLEQKKSEPARESLDRSVVVYLKVFKSSRPDSAVRQEYGRIIGYDSALLSKLAQERGDAADSVKQCRRVIEFQKYLSTSERDSLVPTCEQVVSDNGKGK